MSVQKKSMIALNTNYIIVLWFFLSGLILAPYQDESYEIWSREKKLNILIGLRWGFLSILVCELKLEGKIKS